MEGVVWIHSAEMQPLLTAVEMSTKVAFVIKSSALKHGIAEAEIAHALDHALFWFDMGDFDMYVGPKFDGALLEIGVNREGDVFHAMLARPKFLRQRRLR